MRLTQSQLAARRLRRRYRRGSVAPPGETRHLRPLKRLRSGYYVANDGRWLFVRHESDPSPKRWFAYDPDDQEGFPVFPAGHLSLRAAVAAAERSDVGERNDG